MTRILGLLLVLAYLASAIGSQAWWNLPAADLLHYGGAYGPAVAAGETWRLAAAIFLHGGLLHLAFNLIALHDFGLALERRFGGVRVALVFLSTGVFGFLTSTLWHPDDVSIGASGAIFGLLGWWTVAAWKLGEFLPRTVRRRRLVTLLLIVGIALGFGFVLPGIDNAAHLGGLLAGLALGALSISRPRLLPYAAAAVVLLSLSGSLALPEELAVRYREARAFETLYAHFSHEDRAISRDLLALGEDSRQGKLSDADALARLERDLLPRLATQLAQLEQTHYDTAHITNEQRHWTRYARLRLEALEALRDAVTGRDPQGIRRFEARMNEATQLAKTTPAGRSR